MFFGNKYKLCRVLRLQKLFLISIFSFDNFFFFFSEKKKKMRGWGEGFLSLSWARDGGKSV